MQALAGREMGAKRLPEGQRAAHQKPPFEGRRDMGRQKGDQDAQKDGRCQAAEPFKDRLARQEVEDEHERKRRARRAQSPFVLR